MQMVESEKHALREGGKEIQRRSPSFVAVAAGQGGPSLPMRVKPKGATV